MKNYFIIIGLLFLFHRTLAQTSSDIGKITLSIIMPENVDGLDASQLSKLETKITQIVAASGFAASGYNNNFVIYPKFAVYEVKNVEGGMQNITVTTCDLSLFIKQVDNNVLFASMSKQIKGSGSDKQIAITNSISKISASDAEFKSFIETGKNKILQYYETSCSDIISKADAFTKTDNYDKAIGLLMTVPVEVTTCYEKVQKKAIEAYLVYREKKCKELLLKSKTAIASKDYNSASDYLMQINPETSCYSQAQNLIKEIEDKISESEKREWEFKKQQYKDSVELQKAQINAIKEIAVAYYKSEPTRINYSYIIR